MAAAFRGSSDTNPKPELSAVTETGQPNSEDIAKIEASHSKEKHSMKTTHEPLLLSILEELREIREAQKYEPIKPQFLWTFVLQLFGVAFAIVFGVFAVFGWKSGNHANDLTTTANDDANNNALLANKIALISLCLTEQSNITQGCDILKTQIGPGEFVRSLAEQFFGEDKYTTGSSASSIEHQAITIGLVCGIIFAIIAIVAYSERRMVTKARERGGKTAAKV